MVTEGNYDLHSLIDYDDGVTIDEFFTFHKATIRLQAERMQHLVNAFTLSLASLFDNKVLKEFHGSVKKITESLSPIEPARNKDRRAGMLHTMRELNKLKAILG